MAAPVATQMASEIPGANPFVIGPRRSMTTAIMDADDRAGNGGKIVGIRKKAVRPAGSIVVIPDDLAIVIDAVRNIAARAKGIVDGTVRTAAGRRH